MKWLLILVEGQTEETFVRDVLIAHLASFEVHATPVILKTKRVKAGGVFRGGVTSTDSDVCALVEGQSLERVGDRGCLNRAAYFSISRGARRRPWVPEPRGRSIDRGVTGRCTRRCGPALRRSGQDRARRAR